MIYFYFYFFVINFIQLCEEKHLFFLKIRISVFRTKVKFQGRFYLRQRTKNLTANLL